MGGTAAAGGFAYQHAQAVLLTLKTATDPTVSGVRVEAENDVIDAEVWSTTGELVEGWQFKRRRNEDTWAQKELIKELLRWSDLAKNHTKAKYEFVAEGRFGPTGRLVRDALAAARDGDFSPIIELIGDQKPADFDVSTMSRARISVEESSYLAIIEESERLARSLLPNVSGDAEASERGRWVTLELLHLVTHRSGLADPSARLISRTEVLDLLSTPQDRIPTTAWNDEMKAAFIASVTSDSVELSVQLKCRPESRPTSTISGADEQTDPLSLEKWARTPSICLLGGPSGTGKSTAISAMQLREAREGRIVVVADAEDYLPGRLAALVASSLNAHGNIGAHPAVGNAALTDPNVVLVIDGVSEVDLETRQELEIELRQLLSSNSRAFIMLVGRETSSMRKLLLRHTDTISLIVESPTSTQREELISTTFGIAQDFAQYLARRTYRALGDLAENPLMLLLGAQAIATGSDPGNAADVFQSVVNTIAEANSYTDYSIFEVALGMAFNRLLAQGRRSCDALGWSQLLKSVCDDLNESGIEITAAQLREFGLETGLVRRTRNDTVRALHDSFADYLSALAIARGSAHLPPHLSEQDAARVQFLAGIVRVGPETAELVARDLPFTAVAIAPMESRPTHESWFTETKMLVGELLPPEKPTPRIAFWIDSDGRMVVTVDGTHDGWMQDCSADITAGNGWSFRPEDPTGPLNIAVKIWRRHVDGVLATPRLTTNPIPKTLDDSVLLLKGYSANLVEYAYNRISELGVSGGESEILLEKTTAHIQFLLMTGYHVDEERDRGVYFREAVDREGGAEVLLEAGTDIVLDDGSSNLAWTGRGRVDSFVIEDPKQKAVKRLREEINRLVRRSWL